MSRLSTAFQRAREERRTALVGFITAGFPHKTDTVPAMLALEKGGADVIELGVPFSDPTADGPVIQAASAQALRDGITVAQCLELVRDARAAGVKAPVVLMGYLNPFLAFGLERLARATAIAGADGFIIVDLPPDEAGELRHACRENGLALIPLIAPTSSDARVAELVCNADGGFVYVVSMLGVTGTTGNTDVDAAQMLRDTLTKVRRHTTIPVAIGFGVGTRARMLELSPLADAVVVGSALVQKLGEGGPAALEAFVAQLTTPVAGEPSWTGPTLENGTTLKGEAVRPASGKYGQFGGRFSPETLTACLDELTAAFHAIEHDAAFWQELASFNTYVGRPSPLHRAERLTAHAGGAQIWLKREDLNHTGSHKINNALGQALLAQRLGKRRIIAETGAGQHGVASATVCAKLGLECVVYMGAADVQRQALNVFRMKLLGATVIPVHDGQATLKDAINAAMRDWVTNVHTTHYLVGSAIGPHPFPAIVRTFQSVIGSEARAQMLEQAKALPTAAVACVGGGSNAIGLFHAFRNDSAVKLVGVEAGGRGVDQPGAHSATLSAGTPGVLHGTRTYLLQSPDGQIAATSSISAGLDYPGVGPEHAFLKDSGRAEYVVATDEEALDAVRLACSLEGILPALESAHALSHALKLASSLNPNQHVLVCVSGRGDKDVHSIARALPQHPSVLAAYGGNLDAELARLFPNGL